MTTSTLFGCFQIVCFAPDFTRTDQGTAVPLDFPAYGGKTQATRFSGGRWLSKSKQLPLPAIQEKASFYKILRKGSIKK